MRDLPLTSPPPDILPPVNEDKHQSIDEKHYGGKDITDNIDAVGQNPVENFKRHAERKRPFTGNEDPKQLGGVTIITIDLRLVFILTKRVRTM